jgi:hypothetical protein
MKKRKAAFNYPRTQLQSVPEDQGSRDSSNISGTDRALDPGDVSELKQRFAHAERILIP